MKRYLLMGFLVLTACGGGGSGSEGGANNESTSQNQVEDPTVDPKPLPQEEQPPTSAEKEPLDSNTTSDENLNDAFESVLPVYLLYIYSQNGQFLGFFNDNKFDSYSICNQFGSYGSRFSSVSIWNKFGSYGSDFSSLSAFNDFSNNPPILYAQDINNNDVIALYYITTNEFKNPRIDPFLLLLVLQSKECNISR